MDQDTGGVIGPVLFVGSGAVINQTGPAAVLSYLTWFAIAAIAVAVASMALVDDVRPQLWWGLGSIAVVLGAYRLKVRAGSRSESAPAARRRAPGPARPTHASR